MVGFLPSAKIEPSLARRAGRTRASITPLVWVLVSCTIGCGSRGAHTSPGPTDRGGSGTPLASLAVEAERIEAIKGDVVPLQGRIETKIDLSFTSVTDADLERIKFPDSVCAIDLSGTSVTDRGVEQLKRVSNLESLILMDTQVTEGVVEILKQMPNLCEVRLDNSNVSVASQLELVRFLNPRVSAREERQRAARVRQPQ